MDATDQQARWAETIKDLKEAESFLAPFEVVKPFYRMCDRSHVWKIRFEDGRIGWGRIDHNYYQAKPTYYVPADLARLVLNLPVRVFDSKHQLVASVLHHIDANLSVFRARHGEFGKLSSDQ